MGLKITFKSNRDLANATLHPPHKPVRFALEIRPGAIPMQLRPLTSIRFVFALLVVLGHGLDFLKHTGVTRNWPAALLTVISHGYLGVNFFFVLSGFILAYSYQTRLRQRNDCFEFWWTRFARIYPAYLFAFLVFLPTGIFSAWRLGQPRLALVTAAFQLSLTQSWVPAAALEWNGPAWSLSVEAFFYALFPILFLTTHTYSKRKLVLFLLSAYALSQIGALIGWCFGTRFATLINGILGFSTMSSEGRTLFSMYFPLFRLPEFMFGMALGILFTKVPPLPTIWRHIALLVGCAGFGIAFVVIRPHVRPEMVTNGLMMPFLGLVLFGLAYSKSRLFNHPSFVLLGDASYSLYLLHIPVWSWMQRIDSHLTHVQTSVPITFFIIYLTSAICLSLFSLKVIEIPSRQFIRRRFNTHRIDAISPQELHR